MDNRLQYTAELSLGLADMHNNAATLEFTPSDPPWLHNCIDIHDVGVHGTYDSRNAKLAYQRHSHNRFRNPSGLRSDLRSTGVSAMITFAPEFSYLADQRPVIRYDGRHRVPPLYEGTQASKAILSLPYNSADG